MLGADDHAYSNTGELILFNQALLLVDFSSTLPSVRVPWECDACSTAIKIKNASNGEMRKASADQFRSSRRLRFAYCPTRMASVAQTSA